MKNVKKPIIFVFLGLFSPALALMLRLCSAVNTRLPSEALAKDGLKGFLERSKISFNKFRMSARTHICMYYYCTVFLVLIFTANTYCLIIESNTLETVLDYITPHTLVIFDIDNTLARPAQELSSDEWFCHLVNTKMAEGHDYITSIYYALPATYYAQFNVALQATEISAASLIAGLIDHSIPTMALTTRSLFVSERTFVQLEDINIHFLAPDISQDDLVLPMPHPCFYKNSILFSGNNDKGEALITFFHWMNYYPKKVVFIDDKMKYLLAVEKALKHYNIEFVGIRYAGCDDRVQTFDPAKAESQWRQLRTKKYIEKEEI